MMIERLKMYDGVRKKSKGCVTLTKHGEEYYWVNVSIFDYREHYDEDDECSVPDCMSRSYDSLDEAEFFFNIAKDFIQNGNELTIDEIDSIFYETVYDRSHDIWNIYTGQMIKYNNDDNGKELCILKRIGDSVLLAGWNKATPFVVTSAFDFGSNTWSWGHYFSDLRTALNYFDSL